MKVAIPIWNELISNVFDFSRAVLIVEFDGASEIRRREVTLQARHMVERLQVLTSNNIDVLLCGAISRELRVMVRAAGIEVISSRAGSVKDTLSFIKQQLCSPALQEAARQDSENNR